MDVDSQRKRLFQEKADRLYETLASSTVPDRRIRALDELAELVRGDDEGLAAVVASAIQPLSDGSAGLRKTPDRLLAFLRHARPRSGYRQGHREALLRHPLSGMPEEELKAIHRRESGLLRRIAVPKLRGWDLGLFCLGHLDIGCGPKGTFRSLEHLFSPMPGDRPSVYERCDPATQGFLRRQVVGWLLGTEALRWKESYEAKRRYKRRLFRRALHCRPDEFRTRYHRLPQSVRRATAELVPHLAYALCGARDEEFRADMAELLATDFPAWCVDRGSPGCPVVCTDPAIAEDNTIPRQARVLAVAGSVRSGVMEPEAAVELLGTLVPPDEKDPYVWMHHVEALAACGAAGVRPIEEAVAAAAFEPHVVRYGYSWLATIDSEEAVDALVRAIARETDPTRLTAAINAPVFARGSVEKAKRMRGVDRFAEALVARAREGFPDDETHSCMSRMLEFFKGPFADRLPADLLRRAIEDSDRFVSAKALKRWAARIGDDEGLRDTEARAAELFAAHCADRSPLRHGAKVLRIVADSAFPAGVRDRMLRNEAFRAAVASFPPDGSPETVRLVLDQAPEPLERAKRYLEDTDTDPDVQIELLRYVARDRRALEDSAILALIRSAAVDRDSRVAEYAFALLRDFLVPRGDPLAQSAVLRCLTVRTDNIALRAMETVEERLFEWGPDILERVHGELNRLAGRITGIGDVPGLLVIARAYALCLRQGIGEPRWPLINGLLDRLFRLWSGGRNGSPCDAHELRRAILPLLGSYRLALAQRSVGWRDVRFSLPFRPLAAVPRHFPVGKTEMIAAYIGLGLPRLLPAELMQALSDLAKMRESAELGDIRAKVRALSLAWGLPKKPRGFARLHRDGAPEGSREGLPAAVDAYLARPGRSSLDTVRGRLAECIETHAESPDRLHRLIFEAGERVLSRTAELEREAYLAARHALHNLQHEAERAPGEEGLQRSIGGLTESVRSLCFEKPQSIDLAALLREHRESAGARYGNMAVDCPDEIRLWFDPGRLRTVIDNCLSNGRAAVDEYNADARRAGVSRREPRFTIRCSGEEVHGEPRVRIEIEDNGRGLKQEVDPYAELAADPPSGVYRLGLGTWFVVRYVTERGGEVHAEDRDPDDNLRGARVVIRLPRGEGKHG